MIVLMGVSGCGKTTIGKLLSERMNLAYFDADDFHPKENVEKMKRGIPLNDADRKPWLQNLGEEMHLQEQKGEVILSCSALKESYRSLLSEKNDQIKWVFLNGSYELIKDRMEQRDEHYMKSELLQSQFDVLEIPSYGLHLDIINSPEELIASIILKYKNMKETEIGVFGLGVMGKSLSINIASKGFEISVFNRVEEGEASIVADFMATHNTYENLHGFTDLKEFVASIQRPRKILLMIKAGKVIDLVIDQLAPLLEANDIIIDGGNSYFEDSNRRSEKLLNEGIHFIGCGISGGEEGALKGPSMMPGGTPESYRRIGPLLEAIAAKNVDGKPCCTYIGPEGSGHFIKMVHNGIEYAEMQLLAELYSILSRSMNYDEIAALFSEWNQGELSSYLLEITAAILKKKEGDSYLLDVILDKAGNKGTGSWSSKLALELGTVNTMMSASVFARYISSLKEKRIQFATQIRSDQTSKIDAVDIEELKQAYQFARIINHHQGFELMREASNTYGWKLNFSEIAQIWTSGCIIKSDLMMNLVSLFKENDAILDAESVFSTMVTGEKSIINTIRNGLSQRISLACFSAAYNYWIGITTERLSANMIQAQRDYFGAHTYQRIDKPENESFHTQWEK